MNFIDPDPSQDALIKAGKSSVSACITSQTNSASSWKSFDYDEWWFKVASSFKMPTQPSYSPNLSNPLPYLLRLHNRSVLAKTKRTTVIAKALSSTSPAAEQYILRSYLQVLQNTPPACQCLSRFCSQNRCHSYEPQIFHLYSTLGSMLDGK